MIVITKQPPHIEDFFDEQAPPVPLSDCIEYCLQPDSADVFVSTGAKAKVVITIPATASTVADGTPFTIWGHDFMVDSATPFSSESFEVETVGLLTASNLGNMFSANIFFRRATTQTLELDGSNFVLTVEWRECREQPNFAGTNMDLAVFSSIGGSAVATNGVSPVYVEAYRLLVGAARWDDTTSFYLPLGALAGLEVEKLCDTVGELCLEINPRVADDLFTLLPELTNTSFIPAEVNGRSMMQYYALQYGWTYRENCVPKSGTTKNSDLVLALNAAFDIDDPYQIRRYWNGHPDGFPPGQFVPDFLSTQPKKIKLCRDSFKWLWLLNHWHDEGFGAYTLIARWVEQDANGNYVTEYREVISDPLTEDAQPYQPVSFNASPGHFYDILGASPNSPTYLIQVIGVNPLDHEEIYFNASEYLEFNVERCCDDHTDLYFLGPPGGIDTVVARVDKVETLQADGQEIIVNIPCDASRSDRASYGGRTLTAVRAYQKVYISIEGARNDEWSRWMKHLRQSPQRWIRVKDEGGNPIAKKILFENGAVITKQSGGGEPFEFVGYLQDIPTQQGTEKRF